jgi:Ca2+-transporting ATPase
MVNDTRKYFMPALFQFGPLHANDLALTLGAGIVVLIVLEALKHLWRARPGL